MKGMGIGFTTIIKFLNLFLSDSEIVISPIFVNKKSKYDPKLRKRIRFENASLCYVIIKLNAVCFDLN